MTAAETPEERNFGAKRLVGMLFVGGLGLVGYGSYVHLTMGDRTLGNCLENGVCNPWHPQWVIAPLVVGAVLVLLAGILASRRYGLCV